MFPHGFRVIAVLAALVSLLAVATTAGAKAKPVPPRQILLTVLAGPRIPVDQAAITVTDADGRVVARSRTANAGAARFDVGAGRAPYTITTSGGTVRGRDFEGHLRLVTSRLGGPSGIQYASFATTVAARYQSLYGGSVGAIERRIYKALGLQATTGAFQLKYGTHEVRGHRILRTARRVGGYDALVDDAVARLRDGRPQQSFASRYHDGNYAPPQSAAAPRDSSYQPSAVAAAPCQMQLLPQPQSTMPATVGIYSTMMVAGTVSAFMTKDPSLLLNGVAGMVFGYTPGMTNSSMLRSISAQLTCISAQITQLQNTLNNLKMDTLLSTLKPCTTAVNNAWSTYQQYISNAAANPTNSTYALSTANPSLSYFMETTVPAMYNTSCAGGGVINSTLFSTSGGGESGWQTYLANFKSGTYNSTDKYALSQSSVEELQYFLQYYGVVEYEMAALQTDYFNWEQLVNPGTSYLEAQQIGWGPYCAKAPSLSDLEGNTDVASWCQMQQNIVDVWPSGIYTDEVGAWKNGGTNGVIDPNEIDGIAISAVPAAYGVNTTGWTQTERLVTPQWLGGKSLASKVNIANAVTSYNNQPSQPLTPPWENWNHTLGPKTILPTSSQMSGFDKLGVFFSGQLNSKITTQTATVDNQSTTQTITSVDYDTQNWQLLGSNATMTMSWDSCNVQSNGDNYPTRTVSGAVYSPSHWDGNKLGGESDITNSKSYVCDGIPPIAWMLGRTWTQGGSWPPAPTITTAGTVAANATLAATGCPSSGCTWTITDGAPSGLTISSTTGTLAWTGSAPGTTATIEVVAMNAQMFSAPVSLTVQLT